MVVSFKMGKIKGDVPCIGPLQLSIADGAIKLANSHAEFNMGKLATTGTGPELSTTVTI